MFLLCDVCSAIKGMDVGALEGAATPAATHSCNHLQYLETHPQDRRTTCSVPKHDHVALVAYVQSG